MKVDSLNPELLAINEKPKDLPQSKINTKGNEIKKVESKV